MPSKEPSFTFGIEEEYHLVDLRTRGFASIPPALMKACEAALGLQPDDDLRRGRTLLLELERVYNHLHDLSALCSGVGFARCFLSDTRISPSDTPVVALSPKAIA